MKRCGYCYTDNPEYENDCIFCEAPLNIERKVFRTNKKFDDLDILYLNYSELKKLNQVELLQLLTNSKEQLEKLIMNTPSTEIRGDTSKIQLVFQKKIYLLENLVFDLLGRVPRKTKAEVTRAKSAQRSRTYTHKKHMEQKPISPHHDFIKKRFAKL